MTEQQKGIFIINGDSRTPVSDSLEEDNVTKNNAEKFMEIQKKLMPQKMYNEKLIMLNSAIPLMGERKDWREFTLKSLTYDVTIPDEKQIAVINTLLQEYEQELYVALQVHSKLITPVIKHGINYEMEKKFILKIHFSPTIQKDIKPLIIGLKNQLDNLKRQGKVVNDKFKKINLDDEAWSLILNRAIRLTPYNESEYMAFMLTGLKNKYKIDYSVIKNTIGELYAPEIRMAKKLLHKITKINKPMYPAHPISFESIPNPKRKQFKLLLEFVLNPEYPNII